MFITSWNTTSEQGKHDRKHNPIYRPPSLRILFASEVKNVLYEIVKLKPRKSTRHSHISKGTNVFHPHFEELLRTLHLSWSSFQVRTRNRPYTAPFCRRYSVPTHCRTPLCNCKRHESWHQPVESLWLPNAVSCVPVCCWVWGNFILYRHLEPLNELRANHPWTGCKPLSCFFINLYFLSHE